MSNVSRPSSTPPIENINIYFGRGNGVAQLPGNKFYRNTIKANKEFYRNAGANAAKERVAKDVVDYCKNLGSKFFYQQNKEWVKAPEQEVLKRVKQALREKDREDKNVSALRKDGVTTKTEKRKRANKKKRDKIGIKMDGKVVEAIRWKLENFFPEQKSDLNSQASIVTKTSSSPTGSININSVNGAVVSQSLSETSNQEEFPGLPAVTAATALHEKGYSVNTDILQTTKSRRSVFAKTSPLDPKAIRQNEPQLNLSSDDSSQNASLSKSLNHADLLHLFQDADIKKLIDPLLNGDHSDDLRADNYAGHSKRSSANRNIRSSLPATLYHASLSSQSSSMYPISHNFDQTNERMHHSMPSLPSNPQFSGFTKDNEKMYHSQPIAFHNEKNHMLRADDSNQRNYSNYSSAYCQQQLSDVGNELDKMIHAVERGQHSSTAEKASETYLKNHFDKSSSSFTNMKTAEGGSNAMKKPELSATLSVLSDLDAIIKQKPESKDKLEELGIDTMNKDSPSQLLKDASLYSGSSSSRSNKVEASDIDSLNHDISPLLKDASLYSGIDSSTRAFLMDLTHEKQTSKDSGMEQELLSRQDSAQGEDLRPATPPNFFKDISMYSLLGNSTRSIHSQNNSKAVKEVESQNYLTLSFEKFESMTTQKSKSNLKLSALRNIDDDDDDDDLKPASPEKLSKGFSGMSIES